jgi:hypothetical protein
VEVDDRTFTALTTEHFGLIGARSQAASESATRSTLYLGGVSSTLIGLGLTAQVSDGRTAFRVFALVALPTVFALGAFTFVRLVQLGAEDFLLGRAINRIRHLYLEHAGEARDYFLLSGNDDHRGVMENMGLSVEGRWQLYFTAAVAVAVVNAIVGGSAVALAAGAASSAGLGVTVAVGAAAAIAALAGHLRFQAISHAEGGGDNRVLFPSTEVPAPPELIDELDSNDAKETPPCR